MEGRIKEIYLYQILHYRVGFIRHPDMLRQLFLQHPEKRKGNKTRNLYKKQTKGKKEEISFQMAS